MPPRKSTRAKKAPPPAPEEVEAANDTQPTSSASTVNAEQPTDDAADEQQQLEQIAEEQQPDEATDDATNSSAAPPSAAEASGSGANMDDRMAKLKQLRQRMNDSARANRQDVIAEVNATRATARTLARLERKRAQAEAMGEKQRAAEEGEDLERKTNWEYSIEDNEKWDKKQAKKKRRGQFEFTDYDDVARRKYKKDLDDFKPDLAAYNAQRTATLQSNALVAAASGSSTELVTTDNTGLYRDANSFVYADHKPTDDQIDRVIGKLNSDLDKRQKRSRKRENEDEGDITWINEKNRMFNRKLARYYDDVTKETRDNFEREFRQPMEQKVTDRIAQLGPDQPYYTFE
ncbi:hypothetical protein JCM11641_003568, partial [Rhodosporidiobolus odoratus]